MNECIVSRYWQVEKLLKKFLHGARIEEVDLVTERKTAKVNNVTRCANFELLKVSYIKHCISIDIHYINSNFEIYNWCILEYRYQVIILILFHSITPLSLVKKENLSNDELLQYQAYVKSDKKQYGGTSCDHWNCGCIYRLDFNNYDRNTRQFRW